MALTFKKAEREQIKIKIALAGPAGSGKSEGALALARQLIGPAGKLAALDTENRALSLYADRYDFDVIDLAPPYETRFFAEAIDTAAAAGYDALVIDSLSHQWEGEGGILDRKTREERALGARANGFALWQKYKAEHREFIAKLVNAPIHIIACFRAREEHAQVEDGGRKKIEKLGLAPITGEGAEYEFRVVFALNMEHIATTSKDNTGLFDGRYTNLLNDDPGGRLAAWLATGKAATPRPASASTPTDTTAHRTTAVVDSRPVAGGAEATRRHQVTTLEEALAYPFPFQKGKPQHERPMGELDSEMLRNVAAWIKEKRDEKHDPTWHGDTMMAIALILAGREKDQGVLPLDGAPVTEKPAGPPPADAGVVPPPGNVGDALTPVRAPRRSRRAAEAAPAGDGNTIGDLPGDPAAPEPEAEPVGAPGGVDLSAFAID